MSSPVTGAEIERLIQLLARLPGLGPRSARRAALHLIKKKETLLVPLAEAMGVAVDKVVVCGTCGNIDTSDPCAICTDPRRDRTTLIVVEDVSDLWALERAQAGNALYHVLGGTLSPLDGIGPEDLNIAGLIDRVRGHGGANGESNGESSGDGTEVRELIVAVNATMEGQTTAHYITDQLLDTSDPEGNEDGNGLRITRLAHGVPVGGELDYLDEGTLSAALKSRTSF